MLMLMRMFYMLRLVREPVILLQNGITLQKWHHGTSLVQEYLTSPDGFSSIFLFIEY